jgi:sterol 3beta-glucosyltransferase
MASSIHAIHRPVARSQRRDRAGKDKTNMTQEILMSDTEEEERHCPTILSEEEDDFDPPTIRKNLPTPLKPGPSIPTSRRLNRRFSTTGSMATIRVKRRTQLADKLRDIFELKGIQQVVAGEHCPPISSTRCTDRVLLRNPVLVAAISVCVVRLFHQNTTKPSKCFRGTCI